MSIRHIEGRRLAAALALALRLPLGPSRRVNRSDDAEESRRCYGGAPVARADAAATVVNAVKSE